MSIREPLMASVAALALLSALPGCSRCSRPKPATPAAEPAPKTATPAPDTAVASAPTPQVVAQPGSPADVLVLAPAPLLSAEASDAALRPVAAALRAAPEVEHVWTRGMPGGARMLVRFGKNVTMEAAHDKVQAAWRADAGSLFGRPRFAASARGARAVLAYTLVSPRGRQAATKLARGTFSKTAAGLPGVSATLIAGAVRSYTVVQVDPVALANHGITFARFRKALDKVMAADSVRSVSKRLADTQLARGGPGVAGLPPASLDRLTIQTSGIGEPLREAQVGRNMVTTLLIYSGHGADMSAFFAADATQMHKLSRKLEAEDVRVVSHNLSTAHRFVLTRTGDRAPGARGQFGDRIVRLLKDGGVYDALAVDGVDGIPPLLDDGRPGARFRTLWLLLGNQSRQEEILDRVQQSLAEAGWRAHLMHEAADTHLMWVLGRFGTAGLVLASRNPGELGGPTRIMTDAAKQARSAGLVRTGPRSAPPLRTFDSIDQQVAREHKISGADLAQIHDLVQGPRLLAEVAGGPVWLTLPTDTMAAHVGRLPLSVGKGARSWSDLQRLPADTPQVDRLRADGEPAFWLMVDSAQEGADAFTNGFWQTVERLVEPTPTLGLRPLRLDQRVLGGRP